MILVVADPAELVFDLFQSPKARKAHGLAVTKSGDYIGSFTGGDDPSEIVHEGADVHCRPFCEHDAVLGDKGHDPYVRLRQLVREQRSM